MDIFVFYFKGIIEPTFINASIEKLYLAQSNDESNVF